MAHTYVESEVVRIERRLSCGAKGLMFSVRPRRDGMVTCPGCGAFYQTKPEIQVTNKARA